MNQTQFAYPMVLLLLLLLPIGFTVRFWPRFNKKRQGSFLFSRFDIAAAQGSTWRTRLQPLPDFMLVSAMALVIIAIARPQSVSQEEVEIEGIDIYLALDMSGSMRGVDMTREELTSVLRSGRTPTNRFEYAKQTLKDFVKTRKYDRMGMVVFAKDAYLQFPLTLDYTTILNMLDRLSLGDIDGAGTAIGNALGRAIAGLKESKNKTRLIILITDGDRRGGNISPKQAAQLAKDANIKFFPILVGKEGASFEPAQRNVLTQRIQYVERELPVNPTLLKEIAKTTQGSFYRASNRKGLRERLHKILDQFERSRVRDTTSVERDDLFHRWLFWAIALVLCQFALRHTLLRQFP